MEDYYKGKGADIIVIDMPSLDTRREKNLLDTLISDIVMALLSYVTENERQLSGRDRDSSRKGKRNKIW